MNSADIYGNSPDMTVKMNATYQYDGFFVEVVIVIVGPIVDSFALHNSLITPVYVSDRLPIRQPDGHKGTFGKLFLLAGSTGMTGAAVLAGRASLRSGCGMVKIGCPKTTLPIIASSFIDAVTYPFPDVAKKGCLAKRGLGEIKKVCTEHDAVVIGPGLGRHFETKELISDEGIGSASVM